MTLTYVQSTGELIGLPEGKVVGYSGHPPSKNVPGDEASPSFGPIPRGRWIIGPAHDSPHMGPLAIQLTAAPGTPTFGRDAFFIHGDSLSNPGFASRGCIILPRGARQAILDNKVEELVVIDYLPE